MSPHAKIRRRVTEVEVEANHTAQLLLDLRAACGQYGATAAALLRGLAAAGGDVDACLVDTLALQRALNDRLAAAVKTLAV